jgi:hypothetical protein
LAIGNSFMWGTYLAFTPFVYTCIL